MLLHNWRLIVLLCFSVVLYYIIGYHIARHDTIPLMLTFGGLFAIYIILYTISNAEYIKYLIIFSVLFRIILLFAIPCLSDDVYRFIWDGRLLANGISPFAYLPSDFVHHSTVAGIDTHLLNLLNSPDYFTVYPPLAQFIFWTAGLTSPDTIWGSIVVIRGWIIIAEIGSIYLFTQLCKHYNLPNKNILFYALNPLVITELTGNLHFEAFVIFFMLLATYFFVENKNIRSSVSWAMAIGFKLLPLIFLPLLLRLLPFKKLMIFYLVTGVTVLLFFLPLIDIHLIKGLSSSLGLYFQKFEFNASIYFVLREVGYWLTGYNTIGTLAPLLAGITLVIIVTYSLWNAKCYPQKANKNESDGIRKIKITYLLNGMMWVLAFYLSMTTTVHPWYITPLVAFSVFSRYRFAIWWSGLIFLTYAGYTTNGYQHPYWLIALEYLILGAVVFYEYYKNFIYYKNCPNTSDYSVTNNKAI